MVIDVNSGEELFMNLVMLLYVIVKDIMEMECLFNGLKNEGVILMFKIEMLLFREFVWV